MTPRTVLLVEDEFIIAEYLRQILGGLDYQVLGAVARASDALAFLQQQRPDVVLIDVMLRGELDGIDLAGRLRVEYPGVAFVFVTSLADQATVARAKRTQPHGYLLKPFEPQGVFVALEMAFAALAAERTAAAEAAPPASPSAPAAALPAPPEPNALPAADSFFVRDRKQFTRVDFGELLWLQASRNYTLLHTQAGRYAISHPLGQIEERLPPADFLRVHRSYVVALRHITAVSSEGVTVGGQVVPVGRAYHEQLMGRLNLLTGPE